MEKTKGSQNETQNKKQNQKEQDPKTETKQTPMTKKEKTRLNIKLSSTRIYCKMKNESL